MTSTTERQHQWIFNPNGLLRDMVSGINFLLLTMEFQISMLDFISWFENICKCGQSNEIVIVSQDNILTCISDPTSSRYVKASIYWHVLSKLFMKVSNELLVKLSMHHPAASNNGLIYRTCFRTHLIDCKQRLTGSGTSKLERGP